MPEVVASADLGSLFPMTKGYHTREQTELCLVGTTQRVPLRIGRGCSGRERRVDLVAEPRSVMEEAAPPDMSVCGPPQTWFREPV